MGETLADIARDENERSLCGPARALSARPRSPDQSGAGLARPAPGGAGYDGRGRGWGRVAEARHGQCHGPQRDHEPAEDSGTGLDGIVRAGLPRGCRPGGGGAVRHHGVHNAQPVSHRRRGAVARVRPFRTRYCPGCRSGGEGFDGSAGRPGLVPDRHGPPRFRGCYRLSPPLRVRLERSCRRLGIGGFGIAVVALALAFVAMPLRLVATAGVAVPWLVVLAIAGFVLASDAAMACINRLAVWALPTARASGRSR